MSFIKRFICFPGLIVLLLNQPGLRAQSIAIDNANFNSTATYGAGGNITVPIKIKGCFAIDTKFSLYLSDATGAFPGGGQLIGGYNSFFTPFVNGKLPSGASGNNYKLRVKASSGETAETQAFKISGPGSTIKNFTEQFGNIFAGNDSTYGVCATDKTKDSVDIALADPDGKVSDIVVLDSTGKKLPFTNVGGGRFLFRGAKYNYFTIQAFVKNGSAVSARSFLVVLSSINAGIQTAGKIEICLPESVTFSVNYISDGGIQFNYPSTIYTVSWGDSAKTRSTQCDLIAQKGKLTHSYDTTSCGQPDVISTTDTIHNAFFVQIKPSNEFCPTNFLGTNTTAKVFEKPRAIVEGYAVNCFSDSITLCGYNSDPGRAAPNNAKFCGTSGLTYTWYINQTTFPDSHDSCFTPKNFHIGQNFVKLVVDNGICQDDTTVMFCLDPKPKPSFKLNGQDSVTGCAPLTVKTTNTSNKNSCGKTVYHWFVTDSTGNYVFPGANYSVSPNDSAFEPQFVFKQPNRYYVHLYFINNCTGPFIFDTIKVVTVIGFASVNLPDTQKYCGLKTINFQTDPNHKVTYNSDQGTETYKWTITGGSYTFVNGTTDASRYPQIVFKDFATYKVSIAFHNNCGDKSASQVIMFSSGITASATGGNKDTVLCYSTNSIQLKGATTGNIDSIRWVGGTGTFSRNDTIKTSYTFSTADKDLQPLNLILHAYAKPPSACRVVDDTLRVTFKPGNFGQDTKQATCNAVNYTPSSTINGSTYKWTSVVITGNITGNSATGTGNIKDVLVNKSQKDSGIVQYTITPFADGCNGQPFKLTATVYPTPVLRLNKHRDSICSGAPVAIRAFDSLHNGGYTYTVVAPGVVTGYSNQPFYLAADTLTINDRLINNGLKDTTVLYIITPYGVQPTGCAGLSDTVKVLVRAGSTAANAGTDIGLCNDTSVILKGNVPGSGETGLWKQVQGPGGAIITSPGSGQTTVNKLKPGIYAFEWHINSLKCLSSNDTVLVVNTPAVQNKLPDTAIIICAGANVSITAPAGGGGDGNYKYTWQQSTDSANWADIDNGGGAIISFTPTETVYIRRMIESGNCLISSRSILVTVKAAVNNNNIAADQQVCINNAADTIRGNIPSGGNGNYKYTWQQSTDGNNWLDIANTDKKDYYPGVVGATTYFRRMVNSSLCGNTGSGPVSNVITVTLHNNAVADFSATANKGCTPFELKNVIVNNDHADVNGSYEWYADNSFIGNGAGFPGYAINKDNDSVTIKLKAVSGFGCLSDSASLKFYSYEKPVTSFSVTDSVGCGPLAITFTNTTPNKGVFQFNWDFGNGQTSGDTNPGQIIFLPNPTYKDTVYKVVLSAVTVCDNIQFEKDILVHSKPKASFTPDSSFNCSPRNVLFTNNSAGDGANFVWNFGDGSQIEANNAHTVGHTFHTKDSTVFTTSLIATNGCGSDTAYFNLSVNPNTIDLHFSEDVSQKFNCTGQPVLFKNNTKGATRFNWDFGDPTSGNNNTLTTQDGLGTVTHIYSKPGVYTITLCAGNGCTRDTCTIETVEIKQTPVAAFTAPAEICAGDTAFFVNKSQPVADLSYTWRFGDSSANSIDVNPTHVYNRSGNDTVTLVAEAVFPADLSCKDSVTHIVAVNGPTGQLSYTTVACLHNAVSYQVLSSNTNTYRFYFGDGESSNNVTSPTITHIYKQAGVYVPYVVLTTGNCSKQISGLDTIRIDSAKALFNTGIISYCDSTVVQYTDQSFATFGIKNWQWIFGDGTTATGPSQAHTYNASNNYQVSLIIETNQGCTDSITVAMPLHVKTKPAYSIQSNNSGCVGQPVQYTAQGASADSVSFYNWTFSNNVVLNGASVVNYYAAQGNYTATLITGTVNGCYDTATSNITINPVPTISATADQIICKNNAVQLSATSNASPINWAPVDGTLSCTTCSTTLAAPVKTTQYIASATNAFGCTSSDTVLVTVVQPVHVSITGDTLLCIGDTTRLFAHGADQYTWNPPTYITDGVINAPSAIFQPPVSTQYRVIGHDNSNCFFDTAYVTIAVGNYPKISLGADQVQSTGTLLPLTSSVVNGPIVKWQWLPGADLDCDTCAVPIAHIKKHICYTVTGTNNYGCAATDTLCISVFCASGQVFIPNAFTPDGDGKNDILMIRGKGIKTVKSFRVFSRWGQVVFERSNFAPNDPLSGWDGRINGAPAQPDIFVYACEVECEDGTKFSYKGNVAILR